MSSFKEDRIENEKDDPVEGISLKFINIPLLLLAGFIGFGITYLALQTNKISMKEGDSRTSPTKTLSNKKDTVNGKQIYTTTCQTCHQASGKGIPGAFPPLHDSSWVIGAPKRMVAIVLHGINGKITVKGQVYESVMPSFKDQLSSEEIAAVTSYVRDSFGNKAAPINKDLVDQVRQETKGRTGSWAGEKELNSQKWE